jgi:hypothetical protein
MSKIKVPKFNSLSELDAWVRSQGARNVERKERKVERKRLKKLIRGG